MNPPPPPPSDKRSPVAFYDTECFPNYWLLKFRPKGGASYSFSLRAGDGFSAADISRMNRLFKLYTTVSFNGNGYDVPMITAALAGQSAEQLKMLSDRIIVEGIRPWQLGLPEWRPADHIDVMDVAPGSGSQKKYAGRIHCKTMRDLPYSPDRILTEDEMSEVAAYCENDLDVLEALFDALHSQILTREKLGARYGLDLRSKSDAQVAEAVLKRRCETATGTRIFKPNINWNLKFRYKVPNFIAFDAPQLQRTLELVRESVFSLGPKGSVAMPVQLEELEVKLGASVYKMGIGGLHSKEKRLAVTSTNTHEIRMPDVTSYYPNLILNSGEYPPAMGPSFRDEYRAIKDERVTVFKPRVKLLEKQGLKYSDEWNEAKADDEGGKVGINGGFGKTGNVYSVLFAPEMLIQTTLTGQLSLLMLIEWHEHYGIPVISANTDGIVINCPRDKVITSDALIKEWERRTGLEMETERYTAIYAKDVNNYIAIKNVNDVKRKGEYARASLVEKKNPDVEICADAVVELITKSTPLEYTIASCRDIRKFVTIQTVNGGGIKMWGDGPRKGTRIKDMSARLVAHGWVKERRRWLKDGVLADSSAAYASCFKPQRAEYLGKVVRWYYGVDSPGPIVYASNAHTVGMSYGAKPCMTLPDEFPDDVDYFWYIAKARSMLKDIGYE